MVPSSRAWGCGGVGHGREGGEDENAEGLRPRHEDDQHELDGVHRRVEAALDAVDEAAGGRVDLLLLNLEVEEWSQVY